MLQAAGGTPANGYRIGITYGYLGTGDKRGKDRHDSRVPDTEP